MSSADSGSRGMVLLVDDEELIREMISIALSHAGFTVDVAGSGTEAISRFETEGKQYDLVVTDVIMPDEGGKTLLEYLSKNRGNCKILAVSGFDRSVLEENSRTLPFLQKPFRIHDLIKKIEDILG